ncbi:inner membrane protein YhjD [Acrocarpospora macrocephala]|uniref:Inner membrane protein YhjD n=1 Tax=Acrocarpospora macrocephala TaxID=150177 RepID=A0A5M3X452_9ACTN|nr:YihY/virulence factor BrkB family protein [Acrocarpospora macrocephala]GES15406.1 inner membrane protein YhjD [Acrocarpospora macrocephala]
MIARLKQLIESIKARGRGLIEYARIRFAWIDHLIRTVHRYQLQSGDHLAGSVTYFAFLSFFPLISLVFALFGYVVAFGWLDPEAKKTITAAINEQLPGLADQLQIDQLADARVNAGIIGLVGLLYAGLGSVDALRTAFRKIWMSTEPQLNFFLLKLRDLVALILLGVAMLASVVIAGFAGGATSTVAGWFGLEHSVIGTLGVAAVGILVGLAADILLFLVLLGWLARPKPPQPFKFVFRGAVLGAILFGVLKQLATLLLAHTLSNPVYGTFAVIVGLLIWMNLSARVILYSAAWTATAALGPPPEPSPIPSNGY